MYCRMQEGNAIVVGTADNQEWKLVAEGATPREEIESWFKAINDAIENNRSLDRKYTTTVRNFHTYTRLVEA